MIGCYSYLEYKFVFFGHLILVRDLLVVWFVVSVHLLSFFTHSLFPSKPMVVGHFTLPILLIAFQSSEMMFYGIDVTCDIWVSSQIIIIIGSQCMLWMLLLLLTILPVVSSLKNNQVDRVKTRRKFVTVVILQFLCNTTSTRTTTTGRWQPRLWRPQQQRHPWTSSVSHPWYHRYSNHSSPWFYHHRKHTSMRINNVPYPIMVVNMISIPLMWV